MPFKNRGLERWDNKQVLVSQRLRFSFLFGGMVLRQQPAEAGKGISTWLGEEAREVVLASQFWGKIDFRSQGKYLYTIVQCDTLRNRNYDHFFVTAVNYFDKLLAISFLAWAFPCVTGCNNPIRDKTLRNLVFPGCGKNHLQEPEAPDRDLTFKKRNTFIFKSPYLLTMFSS